MSLHDIVLVLVWLGLEAEVEQCPFGGATSVRWRNPEDAPPRYWLNFYSDNAESHALTVITLERLQAKGYVWNLMYRDGTGHLERNPYGIQIWAGVLGNPTPRWHPTITEAVLTAAIAIYKAHLGGKS